MIELINDYYIDVDPLNYTLKKWVGTDKDGNPTYKTYGYYSNIKECVERCINLIQRDKLSKDTFTLVEALKLIKDSEKEFKQLLEKAIKEIGEEEDNP